MKKQNIIIITLLLSLAFLPMISAWADNSSLIQYPDGCGELNTTNAVYILKNNLSVSSNCFTISNDNISLNLNNYIISINGAYRGIYMNFWNNTRIFNGTVKGSLQGNCIRIENSKYSYIDNVNVSSCTSGIVLLNSTYNNLSNINTYSNSAMGVYLYSSPDNVLTNISAFSNSDTGVYFYNSNNNFLFNSTAFSNIKNGVLLWSTSGVLMDNINVSLNNNNVNTNGIYMYTNAFSNNITNSEISSNYQGIRYYYLASNGDYITNTNFYNNNLDINTPPLTIIPSYLVFTNSFGEISKSLNYDIPSGQTNDNGIIISNNSAYINASIFQGNIILGIGTVVIRLNSVSNNNTKHEVYRNGNICSSTYNCSYNILGSLDQQNVSFIVYKEGNYSIRGSIYPDFLNYTNTSTGNFSVNVNNTNGTVNLNIDSTVIPATSDDGEHYRANHVFTTSGTYPYYWSAYGNGTVFNYNTSEVRSYSIIVLSSSETSLNNACKSIINGLSIGPEVFLFLIIITIFSVVILSKLSLLEKAADSYGNFTIEKKNVNIKILPVILIGIILSMLILIIGIIIISTIGGC